MKNGETWPLVVPSQFIHATRDSGYKSLGSALAELVDNAFEAKAKNIAIRIQRTERTDACANVEVIVCDDGRGMTGSVLRHALQFGWSSRFNRRDSFGRYGMGLPNASLSVSRRVEVYSSCDGSRILGTCLDVDRIGNDDSEAIPKPWRIRPVEFSRLTSFRRGTTVIWRNCDRLMDRKLAVVRRKLQTELGRLFRYQLWSGKCITVNGEAVHAFDPLLERRGANLTGAIPYGPELRYEVAVPGRAQQTSTVWIRFTELPIRLWHHYSNEDKNRFGIAKNAGVSVVRAGREIDRGWLFMGGKRKENYDDWWRCEVRFQPELDELFGVTHTKQEIHATQTLLDILAPDVERIARQLNTRARKAFLRVRKDQGARASERQAQRTDHLLEPPKILLRRRKTDKPPSYSPRPLNAQGLEYRIQLAKLDRAAFFDTRVTGKRVIVDLNAQHPFVANTFGRADVTIGTIFKNMELLLFAAARGSLMVGRTRQAKKWFSQFQETWSNVLATFCG